MVFETTNSTMDNWS